MADETHLAVAAGRSHIIERPRLTRLLNESNARIILLVAPAGYGKTTLARQWLANRPHAWYRGTPASADVAALATGLVQAATTIIPVAGAKVRERLRAVTSPAHDVEAIAAAIADELSSWPAQAWMILDDYQFIGTSDQTNRLVEDLVRRSPMNLLVTSRTRPTWVTARRLLYGDIYELGRNSLAMTQEEGEAVLSNRSRVEVPGLISLAEGWPAVVGLAARAGCFNPPERSERTALYDFFAEELFRDLSPDCQNAIAKLALAPSITPVTATHILGEDATDVLRAASNIGILVSESGDAYDLHPLLRDFLERKLRRLEDGIVGPVKRLARLLTEAKRWDDAFGVIERFGATDLLSELVEHAMPVLLASGRLATLSRWVEYASAVSIQSPILDLAEAELAFREGQHSKAQAFALQAERELGRSRLAARALALAGECAYQRDDPALALELHRRAAERARTPADRRQAIWGEFLAAIQLEHSSAPALLEGVERAHARSVEGTLRVATGRLLVAGIQGRVEDAVTAVWPFTHLLDRCDDPKVRTSFASLVASVLALTAHYADARGIIDYANREAETFQLGFAVPFLRLVESTTAVGLRDFARASETLEECLALAADNGDVFLDISAHAVRAKMLLAHGAMDDALEATRERWDRVPGPGVPGELLGVRALCLACANRPEEAIAVAARAERVTLGVEARALGMCTRAIVACRRGVSIRDAVSSALFTVRETQTYDSLVAAVRGAPELASHLAKLHDSRVLLGDVLSRSRDYGLARHVEIPVTRGLADENLLSPRELEVFGLLRRGHTNKQIAAALVLSEATVKVHVRRILSKLGVRSRTQAVLKDTIRRDRVERGPA